MGKRLIWPSICVVGAGNMGGALLEGWLLAGVPSDRLVIVDPSPSPRARKLIEEHDLVHVPTLSSGLLDSWKNEDAFLVLAVKPAQSQSILSTLEKEKSRPSCVLSVMAGVSIKTLKASLGEVPIVRTMPNLPCFVRKGITAMYGESISSSVKALCEQIMQVVGATMWLLREKDLHAVTVLSGSGPAYIFYMVECLVKAAISTDLDPERAMELIKKTLVGSAALLEESAQSPKKLRQAVASPGGVTEAALSVLMKGNMETMIKEAFHHGYKRSQSLESP